MSSYADIQNLCLASLAAAGYPYTPAALPPDWITIFPQATQYAETRISQEIPLLGNRIVNLGLTTTANSQLLLLFPANTNAISVVEGLALVSGGVSYEYEKASLDTVLLFWPQPSVTMAPEDATWVGRYWAMMQNADTILLAPTPDAAYSAILTTIVPPEALSASFPTTYLSNAYPALYEMACLVFLSGSYKRNASNMSDDPQMSVSWENQYQKLKAAAEFEEKRRRGLLPNEPMSAPPPMPAQRR